MDALIPTAVNPRLMRLPDTYTQTHSPIHTEAHLKLIVCMSNALKDLKNILSGTGEGSDISVSIVALCSASSAPSN